MHSFTVAVGILSLALTANAATVNLPLRQRNKLEFQSRLQDRIEGVQQGFLSDVSSPGGHGTGSAPVKTNITWWPIYTVNITVGTPPQLFSVVIDTTEWAAGIPRANCTKDESWCTRKKHTYDSSLSLSHSPDGRAAEHSWLGLSYKGHLSADTINITDVLVEDFTFLGWEDGKCPDWDWECEEYGFDGVFGLGPPWNAESEREPYSSVLSSMLSQKQLDRNIFSLKLPRTELDEGELRFGDVNPDLFEGELQWLSVHDVSDADKGFRNAWATTAGSIIFDTAKPLRYDIPHDLDPVAVFDSKAAWITLPEVIGRSISQAITWATDGYFDYVICSDRAQFPHLTLELGGHNVTLTGFDYTFEFVDTFYGQMCVSGVSWDDEKQDTIVLGTGFFRGMYTVFDFEERRIGVAKAAM